MVELEMTLSLNHGIGSFYLTDNHLPEINRSLLIIAELVEVLRIIE